jgi:hypothetical protein
MLETLFEHPFSLKRQGEAPLLKEREIFLFHLQRQGTSRAALQDLSNELLHAMRASTALHSKPDQLLVEDLSADLVRRFMRHIEETRKCSVSIRNQRLAAVRTLAG